MASTPPCSRDCQHNSNGFPFVHQKYSSNTAGLNFSDYAIFRYTDDQIMYLHCQKCTGRSCTRGHFLQCDQTADEHTGLEVTKTLSGNENIGTILAPAHQNENAHGHKTCFCQWIQDGTNGICMLQKSYSSDCAVPWQKDCDAAFCQWYRSDSTVFLSQLCVCGYGYVTCRSFRMTCHSAYTYVHVFPPVCSAFDM